MLRIGKTFDVGLSIIVFKVSLLMNKTVLQVKKKLKNLPFAFHLKKALKNYMTSRNTI